MFRRGANMGLGVSAAVTTFAIQMILLALMASGGAPAHAQVVGGKNPNRADNGAIAYHRETKNFGYAVDRRTSREARVEALKQCGHEKCEVVLTLKNGCGALASGSKTYFASRGATRQEAETKALRQCGKQCEVLAWACTK